MSTTIAKLRIVMMTKDNFDKLFKICPLLDRLNVLFQNECVSSLSQSVDEAMILFKGRNSMKQYMPLKPVKRGYKVWMRCDSKTGYVYQFDAYRGRDNTDETVKGLGAKVVKKLTATLHNSNSHVAFDNFFSSFQLLQELQKNQIYATATVRSNRLELPVIARKPARMERGQFKWRSRDNVSYVQWMDTKHVHVISTAFSPTDTSDVNRRQKDGTLSTVTCPSSVIQYTARMGGVDRFDERRSHYSVSRRSRKWWLRIFYFLLDSCIVNAYVLYTAVHPEIELSMLKFREKLF